MSGLQAYNRTIPAGKRQTIGARGTTIVLHSTNEACRIVARSNKVGSVSGEAYSLILRNGEKWFTSTEFDAVEVESLADPEGGNDLVVELFIGYGDFIVPPPALSTSDNIQGSATIEVQQSDGQQLFSSNPLRWRAHIQASSNNTVEIVISGTQADAVAGNGLRLIPGQTLTLETRGQIWGFQYGPNQFVHLLEEEYNA